MSIGLELNEPDAIQRVSSTLEADFGDWYATADIDAAVEHAYRAFDGAPVREFIPVLVEGTVRRELKAKRHAAT